VIVVVGRPFVALGPAGPIAGGVASLVAMACVKAGAKVELVGTIGDDDAGDAVAVDLARAGVGHAALLRIPGVATSLAVDAAVAPGPRLDGRDLDLGLRYVADFRVLVAAEPLPAELEAIVLEAAAYAGAAIVAVTAHGGSVGGALADAATLLEAPEEALGPFAEMVGRYAAGLDAGADPAAAFAAAAHGAGWEPAG
jgi:ribokinase